MVVIATLILLVPACSSDQSDPGVIFEAQWQCDVQRMTFDDLADIQAARSEALAEWGLSEDEYEAFRAELQKSGDLRSAVQTAYSEYCEA